MGAIVCPGDTEIGADVLVVLVVVVLVVGVGSADAVDAVAKPKARTATRPATPAAIVRRIERVTFCPLRSGRSHLNTLAQCATAAGSWVSVE